jgi:serpin B
MLRRTWALAPLFGLSLGLAAAPVQGPDKKDEPKKAAITREDVADLVKGNNALAVELYRKLSTQVKDDANLFYSPYSVAGMLGLAYAGSGGKTQKQMTEVLHFKQDADTVCRRFEALGKTCTGSPWAPAPFRPRFGALVTEADGVVKIDKVAEKGPAAEAGLKAGDVIQTVNGQPVKSALDLFHALDRPGESATLTVNPKADGSATRVEVKFASPPERFVLKVAHGMWGQKGLTLNPIFEAQAKSSYDASVNTGLDFAHDLKGSVQRINDWAKRQTDGKIEELLPASAVSPETQLVVANTIYFRARWLYRFDKKLTAKADFFAPGGKVEADMMHLKLPARMLHDDKAGVKVLELGYQGGDVTMVVLLPDARDGLPALEKKLTGPVLAAWLDALGKQKKLETRLWLPRFMARSRFDLRDALKGLGLTLAFGPEADYSALSDVKNLTVSALLHQAAVTVDEDGTEAAAATGQVVVPATGTEQDFRADHPFLFLLRDGRSGSVLFMGRVVKPS